jgi:DNA-binding GntR family transcriptional regulator
VISPSLALTSGGAANHERRTPLNLQIVSQSKIQQVGQAILLQIRSGDLLPGQRLPEAKLAEELNVSQATVNSALQDLHNQGLVTKLLNRSTRVSRYTQAEIENLFRVRLALEPVAAEAVAQVWSSAAHAQLRERVDQMRRSARVKDLAKFCLADYNFHQDPYKLTGNPFLIQACQAMAAAPFAYILCDHLEALPTDYLSLAEDHQDLILAMEESPAEAARVMRRRIAECRDLSIRALGSASGSSTLAANVEGNSTEL